MILPDSEIVSATLTLNIFDEGTVGDRHGVLIDWDGGVTYQSFGDEPGVRGEAFN